MQGRTIDQLSVGDTAESTKTISESDIYLYAGITGDLNPAHVNEVYASASFAKGRIAHGMLVGGLLSAVLGMQLPGPGSIYVSQELTFKAPVRIGDTITARVEVTEILHERKRVVLRTYCTNQDDTVVIDGKAVLSPPRPPRK